MKNINKYLVMAALILLIIICAGLVKANTILTGLEFEGGTCNQDSDCTSKGFCVGTNTNWYSHKDVQSSRIFDAMDDGYQGVCYRRYVVTPDNVKSYQKTVGIAAYCEPVIEYVNTTIEVPVEKVKVINETVTLTEIQYKTPLIVYVLWAVSLAASFLTALLLFYGTPYKFHGVGREGVYKTLFSRKLLYRKRVSHEEVDKRILELKNDGKESFIKKAIGDKNVKSR